MRLLYASVVLLAGCDRVFGLESPPPPDADTSCYGRYGEAGAGLLSVCLEEGTLTSALPLGSIATGNGDDCGDCTQIVTQADAVKTEVCVIAATTIDVTTSIDVTGRRPLALVATDTLTITSTGGLRARALVPGSGSIAYCLGDGTNGTSSATSGGGGAGGSFRARGGGGGAGTTTTGGGPLPPDGLGFVRVGCYGGRGGDGDGAGGAIGVGGGAGGALYLIAGSAITVAGRLDVSGGGGLGGGVNGGGGGGGSGGLVGLDAPRIVLAPSAAIAANGGGGGGGGGTTGGRNGREADLIGGTFPFEALGGEPGSMATSYAGKGGHAAYHDGENAGSAVTGGGSGGGGGVGYVVLYAPSIEDDGARITPAPGG